MVRGLRSKPGNAQLRKIEMDVLALLVAISACRHKLGEEVVVDGVPVPPPPRHQNCAAGRTVSRLAERDFTAFRLPAWES